MVLLQCLVWTKPKLQSTQGGMAGGRRDEWAWLVRLGATRLSSLREEKQGTLRAETEKEQEKERERKRTL